MGPTRDELPENLAKRWWEVARGAEARAARQLSRQPVVDGVARLDEGALLDDGFHFLEEVGVMAWLSDVHGTAMQREMVPVVQYLVLDGLKTLFDMASIKALPALLVSDQALRRLVGFKAPQGWDGQAPGRAYHRPALPGHAGKESGAAELAGAGGGVQWRHARLGDDRDRWCEGHGHRG